VVRPTHAVVDLDGLTANYRAIRALLDAGADAATPHIIAVIKANAYGHGAVRVAQALERDAEARGLSPPMLACADIEEGVELRARGVRAPILVFGALSVSDLDGVFAHDLTPTVSSPFAARALQQAAQARDARLRVHLKIDTGMNRFGFRYDNLGATLPGVLRSSHLKVEAVYTHFATAEDGEHPLFERQRTRFEAVRGAAAALGLAGAWWHAANSAALLRDRKTWYDAVRPGLLLYGIAPPPLDPVLSLRPVMSLHSRVVAVKGMRPGETAGYGGHFVAGRALRVALIPAGYADGLDLRLAGRGVALVGGVRAPIAAVSMDSTVVDVTAVEAGPGDEVVLLGSQGAELLGACDVAGAIGTVPHEILCRIGARIERTYNP